MSQILVENVVKERYVILVRYPNGGACDQRLSTALIADVVLLEQ